MKASFVSQAVVLSATLLTAMPTVAGADDLRLEILRLPAAIEPLTEPACSYCSTQDRKGLVRDDDRVLAWLRGAHNGGAFPLRHFLAGPRVINDTYGLFFFDPDGGYVAAYKKDYGYQVHGMRAGVMVVEGRDGTLWSALSGRAIEGPQKGARLERVPSMVTTWRHWLMLHPESTAYDLYDGKKYLTRELPTELSAEAQAALEGADRRLPALAHVLGVETDDRTKAYPLDAADARDVFMDRMGDVPIAVFWYQPTQTAVAFRAELDGRELAFDADEVSPETAPFKDRETGTRWTLAGRAVDGPLRGRELEWIDSVQCRWYAWAAEFPETAIHDGER